MQQVLKVSTAFTTIVGPALDSAGAAYTGLVIGDLNITKNGTTAAMAAAATLTHDHNGHYILVGTTGNSDTLGRLDVTCNKATYAMPPKCFEVLSAAAFDTLVTNGTLASTTSGRTLNVGATGVGEANGVQWLGGTIPAVNVTGVPLVDAKYLLGTVFATPATAGIMDVNAKNVNNVSASSVTTINANVGTTQPVNYTGTGASALVKSDMVDIAGAAVDTTAAQVGVSVVNYASGKTPLQPTVAGRTLDVTTTGEAGIDWGNVGNAGTTINFTGTTVNAVTTANLKASESQVVTFNTAASGSTAAVVLDASESAVDDFYKGASITIYLGPGAGQTRTISAYNGTTKTATVDRAFITAPTSASNYSIRNHSFAKLDSSLQTTAASVTGAVGSVTGAVGSVTAGVTVTTNNDKTGYALSSAGVQAVWDYVVENSKTAVQYLRVIKAAIAGKLSGAATTTVTIRDDADSKARITATVDASGNRSAVTLDGT